MKKDISFYLIFLLLALLIAAGPGCKREIDGLNQPGFPTNGDVFIDDFTADLAYAAFGGSDVKAFQVDTKETFGGSRQSMRFEVPDANSPEGGYAGGVFFSKTGRDLSGYNAITFYIKSTQPANIGILGFGNDLGESRYQVNLANRAVNTNWEKVILPIPDASKLTKEKGLFYYSTGPENDRGYTFWIDELKFEKVPNLGNLTASIQGGEDKVIPNAENGDVINMQPFEAVVNLPTGVNQTVSISPNYFAFESSTPSVATVSAAGVINVLTAGTTTVTAKLANKAAAGSVKLTSVGQAILPPNAAPTPTHLAANVISMFSNAYTNVPIDKWNTRWQFSTAEETYVKVNNNDIIRYKSLNFVGIEFSSTTINASTMGAFHMDIWTPDATAAPNNFKILLVDFGANGIIGGNDDKTHEITIARPLLVSNSWVSIDVPLSSFTGLTTRAHLGQLVLSGSIPNVFIDNVYFYKQPSNPTVAAPTPTRAAANVLSIFSDAYTNVAGTDFTPNWGQNTVPSITQVAGNNTLSYLGLNYQGIVLASAQNVSTMNFLHLDYFTTNSTALSAFLISAGPVEKGFVLPTPTAGWNSIDIPLSSFSPVALNQLIQMKFDGNGDVYLDNIYFYRQALDPTTAAPAPTFPAANVRSVFSDAYPNIPGTNYNPGWGQNTVVSQVAIGGNNTMLFNNLNYQGFEFAGAQNVTDMTHLHLNYFSGNSTELKIFIISPGPVEKPYTLTVPTAAGWNTVDIPLTSFSPVALNNVIQFKFEGNGKIYLDNILFHK